MGTKQEIIYTGKHNGYIPQILAGPFNRLGHLITDKNFNVITNFPAQQSNNLQTFHSVLNQRIIENNLEDQIFPQKDESRQQINLYGMYACLYNYKENRIEYLYPAPIFGRVNNDLLTQRFKFQTDYGGISSQQQQNTEYSYNFLNIQNATISKKNIIQGIRYSCCVDSNFPSQVSTTEVFYYNKDRIVGTYTSFRNVGGTYLFYIINVNSGEFARNNLNGYSVNFFTKVDKYFVYNCVNNLNCVFQNVYENKENLTIANSSLPAPVAINNVDFDNKILKYITVKDSYIKYIEYNYDSNAVLKETTLFGLYNVNFPNSQAPKYGELTFINTNEGLIIDSENLEVIRIPHTISLFTRDKEYAIAVNDTYVTILKNKTLNLSSAYKVDYFFDPNINTLIYQGTPITVNLKVAVKDYNDNFLTKLINIYSLDKKCLILETNDFSVRKLTSNTGYITIPVKILSSGNIRLKIEVIEGY